MSAGSSTACIVFIKSIADAGFGTMSVGPGELVGTLLDRACAKYTHWKLNALQMRLFLVAEAGDEPSGAEIGAALELGKMMPLSVNTPVLHGSWLVARPSVSGGAAPTSSASGTTQGPLPPIPLHPMPSPTSPQAKCFLTNDQVGFLPAPATLPCDPSVAAAFCKLLGRVDNNTRGLMTEKTMYASASSLLPAFARRVVDGVGTVSAQALFTTAGLRSRGWEFSPQCQPKLHVCADTSPARPFRPGFNGEVKSAGDGLALEQAAYYTAMDMTRVFFPAVDAHTPCPRRYFTSPPLGFAIVGFPHVAYIVALEWIGKLLVSPLSQPFILESEQHAAAVAGLPDVHYQEPVELGEVAEDSSWLYPNEEPSKLGMVSYHVGTGLFRKLVRGDARTAAQFARMARAYTALADHRFHPEVDGSAASAPQQQRPAALVGLTGLRLLYGAHEVLLEMKELTGRPCNDAELTCSSSSSSGHSILEGVADALAWLAVRGLVYTDLRGPNVLLDGSIPQLLDFDDCVVLESSVCSVEGFKAVLADFVTEEKLLAGFAVRCAAGAFPELEQALGTAFAKFKDYKMEQKIDAGEGGEGESGGIKRPRG